MKNQSGHLLAPRLDLPQKLYHQLIEHIGKKLIIKSASYKSINETTNWFQQLIYRWYLGQGQFQVYRLPDEIETEITNHYSEFLKYINRPVKIRLKSMSNCRGLMPHSDANSGGDTASLTIGVMTNNEITHWYNAGAEFDIDNVSLWQLFRLKQTDSMRIQDTQACLFNNERVHSVSNGNNASRFLLVLSWQDVTFDQLQHAYLKWISDRNK